MKVQPHDNYMLFKQNFKIVDEKAQFTSGKSEGKIDLTLKVKVDITEKVLIEIKDAVIQFLKKRFSYLNDTPHKEMKIFDYRLLPPNTSTAQLAVYGNGELESLVDFSNLSLVRRRGPESPKTGPC